MVKEGADIIDIGAESSRPGRTESVTAEEEWERIEPVIAQLRQDCPDVLISIDTYKGETVRRSLEAGAHIINDIYALRRSPEIAELVAHHHAGLILMHMQNDPETMQQNPTYGNVLAEIGQFLKERLELAQSRGVAESALVIDPGIGFGKTPEHDTEILAGLEYLRLLQRPICVGASRKKFLGALTGIRDIGNREEATVAAHCIAVLHGGTIVRTHNVAAARQSLAVVDAVRENL
jgi:dihydropteroate synthase